MISGLCGPATGCSATASPPATVDLVPAQRTAEAPRSRRDGELECRCDVLDFESDGPPTGSCKLTFDNGPDGNADLVGESSKPKLKAHLRATPPEKRRERVFYAFEGDFDFECAEPWCGHRDLDVLAVGKHDYRATVARSDEGPPTHVLWVTCSSP